MGRVVVGADPYHNERTKVLRLRDFVGKRDDFFKAFPHDSGEGVAEGRRMRVDICTRTVHQISVNCILQNCADVQPFHRPDKEHQSVYLSLRRSPCPFAVPEIIDFDRGTLIRSLHPPPAALPHSPLTREGNLYARFCGVIKIP